MKFKEVFMGVNESIKWMKDHHRRKGNYPYSMVNRYGNPGYDCSSSVYYALIAGGVLPKNIGIGNTETLFKLKGKYLDEIYSYNEIRPGDIFIRGGEGTSLGAAGHTGIFTRKGEIIHSNYTNNGISINDESTLWYFLDRKRSTNERYFRPRYDKAVINKPKIPVNKKDDRKLVKYEKWRGITQAVCNVRSGPSLDARIVAQYRPQEVINYDQVWEANGYKWISYVSYSGERRYVAYRKLEGDTRSWIVF